MSETQQDKGQEQEHQEIWQGWKSRQQSKISTLADSLLPLFYLGTAPLLVFSGFLSILPFWVIPWGYHFYRDQPEIRTLIIDSLRNSVKTFTYSTRRGKAICNSYGILYLYSRVLVAVLMSTRLIGWFWMMGDLTGLEHFLYWVLILFPCLPGAFIWDFTRHLQQSCYVHSFLESGST